MMNASVIKKIKEIADYSHGMFDCFKITNSCIMKVLCFSDNASNSHVIIYLNKDKIEDYYTSNDAIIEQIKTMVKNLKANSL